MPYVFTTNYLPTHKTEEAAKIYIESLPELRKKERELAKEIIPNAVKVRKGHIEVTSVYDIKPGKLEEFLLHQNRIMTRYHKIEGMTYTIEVRLKVTEALEMIGMKPPD